jgi:glycosyltransferase involved in cell wall biosynthesis
MLDLSVTISTLNEEENIEECLKHMVRQSPKEIIVCDGGSDDRTREIAAKYATKVINVGRKGLGFQRKTAVDAASCKYIATIDADQRFEREAFKLLIEELEKNGYAGIEAQIISVYNKGYWDWAMEQNFKLTHNMPGPRIVIGGPCVYRGEVIKKINFDPFFIGTGEDTDLSYRLVKNGYKLGVGTPKCFQEHRSDFNSFRKKWIWYGEGDARFCYKHPERTLSILKHQLFNYPIKKSLIALSKFNISVVPFFILCGLFRFYGMVRLLPRLLIGKDTIIYRT